MKNFLVVFLLLLGCGPKTSEDFLAEGEAKTLQLVSILKRLDTKEDLLKAEPILKKKFQEFGTLILSAQNYLVQNPNEIKIQENRYSNDLLQEMRRIYKIQGGREIMERAGNQVERLRK